MSVSSELGTGLRLADGMTMLCEFTRRHVTQSVVTATGICVMALYLRRGRTLNKTIVSRLMVL